jgi:hypothetical protein
MTREKKKRNRIKKYASQRYLREPLNMGVEIVREDDERTIMRE